MVKNMTLDFINNIKDVENILMTPDSGFMNEFIKFCFGTIGDKPNQFEKVRLLFNPDYDDTWKAVLSDKTYNLIYKGNDDYIVMIEDCFGIPDGSSVYDYLNLYIDDIKMAWNTYVIKIYLKQLKEDMTSKEGFYNMIRNYDDIKPTSFYKGKYYTKKAMVAVMYGQYINDFAITMNMLINIDIEEPGYIHMLPINAGNVDFDQYIFYNCQEEHQCVKSICEKYAIPYEDFCKLISRQVLEYDGVIENINNIEL